MLRTSRQWDIRCPRALTNMFPERSGYYYKVTRVQARRIVRALCRAYGVPTHYIGVSRVSGPPKGCNGQCTFLPHRASLIEVHARGHIKTVFHEFYHALDHYYQHKLYNSSDRQGGPSSLAWQFADHLFEVFRRQR